MTPLQKLIEERKEEVRNYFDKTLTSKKPSIKNLDREILAFFVEETARLAFLEGLKAARDVLPALLRETNEIYEYKKTFITRLDTLTKEVTN